MQQRVALAEAGREINKDQLSRHLTPTAPAGFKETLAPCCGFKNVYVMHKAFMKSQPSIDQPAFRNLIPKRFKRLPCFVG